MGNFKGSSSNLGTTSITNLTVSGDATVTDEISGSGVLNIVGATTLENTLHVSGSVVFVGGVHSDIALDINAVNQAANVIDIAADALTSGDGISVASNSSNTAARSLLKLTNDHASATGASLIEMDQDSTGDLITVAYGANGTGLGLKIKETSVDIASGITGSDTTMDVSGFFPANAVPIAIIVHITTGLEAGKHITKLGTAGVDDCICGGAGDGGVLNNALLDEDGDTLTVPISPFGGPFAGAGAAAMGVNSAQDLRITVAGANPNAGVARCVLYYWDITPPTS